MLVTFATHTLIMKEGLSASKSSTCCESSYAQSFGFKDAQFRWSLNPKDGIHTPSGRTFQLRIEGDLYFRRGTINLITAPPTRNAFRSWGVAYAAQESWVQNETIRNNILFGTPFDEIRYNKVIKQCAFERDLELFEAGDETEVGERGLTLRRCACGCSIADTAQARITLARAVYSSAEIILLDDVLAALDVHTSKWIVNNCLRGDLIRGRTVLLVTHDVSLWTSIAGFSVTVGPNGQVYASENTVSTAIESNAALNLESEEPVAEMQFENFHPTKGESTAGKLVIAEEVAHGHVSWKAIKLFLGALGGKHVILFFSVWIGGTLAVQYMTVFSTWFLGYWGSQYEIHHGGKVRVFLSYLHRARFIDWDPWHVNRSHIPQGPIVFKMRDERRSEHMVLSRLSSWSPKKELTVLSSCQWRLTTLERMLAYIEIDQEAKPTEAETRDPRAENSMPKISPPGILSFQTGPTVLHGLSFHVKSGERVGIGQSSESNLNVMEKYSKISLVGRTGSGKSSLALSLLRCIVTEGDVLRYDNISTSTIYLDALRSNITIIPQMPELLSGTLRRNLDPFEQHGDAALNDSLRSDGLFSLQDSTDKARLALDSNIATGGSNISVGQRQIIALTKAILQRSKLLIVDEATSSIDHKTDTVIQTTLRNELASDVTVLTISHRLQTIMDADKIVVLDNGRIVFKHSTHQNSVQAEFEAPNELLKKEGSLFLTKAETKPLFVTSM
ncbi:hypothetical protein K443DRAFT_122663 [Laccaria amethystina LaAM-08-1]|uniref:ABC transporter domain-containing protein n=1 Tax=Laccaria amethystina LaAM-08-1 TaxID=1095629 RepID=A0A0C9X6W2_9AGAR|nr:hypothetical protein K443DRAFT_122663 [Laccaria amethystina LaAM-08-1]